MTYRAIGLMSGSSLDGLDLAFVELVHGAGNWSFEILAADCFGYDSEWSNRLASAVSLNALDYQRLHTDYGRYLGQLVNRFIEEQGLHYKTALISSHGHTTFHEPHHKMTAQLGDGAALAAETGLPVVSDLRALDVAFGGQGAPIVPMGEKLLLKEYGLFLNLGGIANISINSPEGYIAFDICPANRVLNLLVQKEGKDYDAGGAMAAMGTINDGLLHQLNQLPYYSLPFPKSLANNFGTDEVYPLITMHNLTTNDALRTYVEHIVQQVKAAAEKAKPAQQNARLLVTGGGAFNTFLVDRLKAELDPLSIEVVVPDDKLVNYKEALIMAFLGVLRWRQEYTVLPTVTGARRASIGGALWIGQEA